MVLIENHGEGGSANQRFESGSIPPTKIAWYAYRAIFASLRFVQSGKLDQLGIEITAN